jgi:SAM-dependent methyltransferase
MLFQAQKNGKYGDRLEFQQGNATELPFADNYFDAVFNTISFLHYPNPEQVFAEVSRVLRSPGYFYLADYTVREDLHWRFFPFSPGGLRFYSPQQREKLGKDVNLECLGHYYLLGNVLLTVYGKRP